jgi:peptide deformylase|tara:strand:- start:455 stop:991 length:537 start_codon:yes stop_codon:yes gene_type:complete
MLESLEILQFPDERLRRLSQPVVDFNQELKALAERMLEIMYESNGIGLAAPQVNQTIRLIVVDVSEGRDSPCIFVNPKIKQPSGSVDSSEGCLSVPEIRTTIKRYETITVEYFDLKGEKHEEPLNDLMSICVQHEIDHLDGKLFIDYVPSIKLQRLKKKIAKNKKNQSPAQGTTARVV